MANIIFYIWLGVNMLLLIHVLHELSLVFSMVFKRRKNVKPAEDKGLPYVTIQLPLYNEKYVIERLLEAVSQLDYPDDLLEIQILDDSNDETSEIIQEFIERTGSKTMHHIRREEREGFKAGALQYGLKSAKGELIAIFDADFVPDPQFLKKTIPIFSNPEVGVVQTRWTFINENYSLLTRAQAVMLKTHFSIEQLGRSRANGFINFNGTAGIWRKACITDAGGWKADTLTEDLDLSFRAQSRGWKFEYLFDVGSPSELPVTFEAFRTQQFRWSKGAAECLRKNARMLWKSGVSFTSKVIGTFHLLNSSVYLLAFLLVMLSPFVFYFTRTEAVTVPGYQMLSSVGLIVFGALFLIFSIGYWSSTKATIGNVLLYVPAVLMFFAMTMGISVFMVMGVLEGYAGKRSEFVRTPKFGSAKGLFDKVKKGYDFKKEASIALLEAICLAYGLFWLVMAVNDLNAMLFVYSAIILTGFTLSLFLKRKTFKWSS